ncbi:MAG: hypothetical protein M1828_003607 [Chrysothrix sp. TS-e1954]|nr:MAG: hypothetical protein M1828_003607 [Chrysothrix sp. TS-e1954]
MGPLPTVLTSQFLSYLRNHRCLPRDSWYFVAGVTLSALNLPHELPRLLTYALNDDSAPPQQKAPQSHDERLRLARRLREGLIKSAAIVGLPKTINALMSLKAGTPENLLDISPVESDTSSLHGSGRAAELWTKDSSPIVARGQAFFDRIYGKITHRVMSGMDRIGTPDLGVTARLAYAYLLSNEEILDAKDSSMVLIAGLVPQDVNPQLKGHLQGAINNGATLDEVRACREVSISICKAAGMTKLQTGQAGWGWREDVAELKHEERSKL